MLVSLLIILLLVAIAYAAVGHGGASGYLAVLLLAGFVPESLRPLVLVMNIVVTTYLLVRTKRVNWQGQKFVFVLILASLPAAFLGGFIQVNDSVYRIILGVLLLISAARLSFTHQNAIDESETKVPSVSVVLVVGILLGFISGLTGIGGGVLLSPLLILFSWVSMRQSIPVVAVFILMNSLAGLVGWISAGNDLILVDKMFFLQSLLVALTGAILGSFWSKRVASVNALRYVLVGVLVLAGIKMIGMAL